MSKVASGIGIECSLMGEGYNPRTDDVAMWNPKTFQNATTEMNKALFTLLKLQRERPKSIVVELNTYRKYVPALIELYFLRDDMVTALGKEIERFHNDCDDKKHKRWTKEEDNILIDIICSGQQSPMETALVFGRSVSAIKTRVSTLVGKKRISQKVAGKFIGRITTNDTETHIDGVLVNE